MALEPKYFRKMACKVKVETEYGEDALPVAGDNILMSNVNFRPMVAQRLTRDLMLPWLGNQGVILAGIYATIEGDIEIAGSGVLGTPPKWGSVAKMTGMAETITPGQKVEYSRVEDGDSGSVYFVIGKIQHVLLGAKANLAPSLTSSQIPRMRATITGLLGTITDTANPVVTKTGWTKPVPVSKDNTTLSIHGWDAVAESLSINLGNTVTPSFLIGDELIAITGVNATGTAVVRPADLATINFFQKAIDRSEGVINCVHGKTAGNIVEFQMAQVETGEPEPGNTDGFLNYSLALDILNHGTGDIKIVVR
ncbi:hypothetical protein [Pararhizobium gei]|uniref:hypothetical protein n=1 Tax=Pararhizobium gei TaxID=1395951 RepID=UPI0023DA77FE|nr:hypothetical protein [Rhizobium gei]